MGMQEFGQQIYLGVPAARKVQVMKHAALREAGSRTAEGTRRDGELGAAAGFLASDAPSFMTGEVTVMDGGYSLF